MKQRGMHHTVSPVAGTNGVAAWAEAGGSQRIQVDKTYRMLGRDNGPIQRTDLKGVGGGEMMRWFLSEPNTCSHVSYNVGCHSNIPWLENHPTLRSSISNMVVVTMLGDPLRPERPAQDLNTKDVLDKPVFAS